MKTLGEKVRFFRNQEDLSQLDLAKIVGVSQAAIGHVESGKIRKPTFILKLAAALKLRPEYLEGTVDINQAELRKLPDNKHRIAVSGIVQAGAWRDVTDFAETSIGQDGVVADAGHPVDQQTAYEVVGESLNKVAKQGDVLLCLNFIGSGIEIAEGDLVIVERKRFDGQQVELTAKRIKKTTAGFELWPESSDPNHQTPIVLNDAEEHEEIRVSHKVLWVLSKP